MIVTKPIAEGESCEYCDIPKPAKGVVRMSTESIFYIELLPKNKISFKLIGRDDLKIRIMPAALLNHLSQGHLPFDLMRTVYRTIRNFENSPWDIAMRERHLYYKEIEDKVHEQLENWKDTDEQSSHNYETAKGAAEGKSKKTAGPSPIVVSRQREHFMYRDDDDDEKSRKGRWILCMVITFASFAVRQGYGYHLQGSQWSTIVDLLSEPQNLGLGVVMLACLLVTSAVFRRQKSGAASKDQGKKSATNVERRENPINRDLEVIDNRTPTPDTEVPDDSMDSRPRPQSQPQARKETRISKLGRRLKRLKKVFKRKRRR